MKGHQRSSLIMKQLRYGLGSRAAMLVLRCLSPTDREANSDSPNQAALPQLRALMSALVSRESKAGRRVDLFDGSLAVRSAWTPLNGVRDQVPWHGLGVL